MVQIDCIADTACDLGESPAWDERTGDLWFVDIKAPAAHRLNLAAGDLQTYQMPCAIGALALRQTGGLIVSLKTGFAFFDPLSGRLSEIAAPEPHLPGNRLNDAKCDAKGRYWAGSMDDGERQPTGHLHRLDPDLSLTSFEIGFVVTNGPAFSPDGRTLYFADSAGRVIHAYDYDLDAGDLGLRRIFAALTGPDGHPDGMCVDTVGGLWSARWGGAGLARYLPDGTLDRVIEIPALQVTSACFGGPDFRTLYVTSARVGLDGEALADRPQSGGVFTVTGLEVQGAPAARFGG
ncbi:MAG: SMP-30/gluconolactonase/LRE family protein [Caulobacteraceae bacterium]